MNLRVRMEKVINSSSYRNMAGIIVWKDGIQQYEKYYNGCTEESSIHVASVTKSIVSMLFGIAVDRGEVKSLDQKVLEFFPHYQVRRGETAIQNITLKNMLTMTANYRCKTEPYEQVFTSEDWIKPALDLLGGKDQTVFRYSPIIGTHILSGIFTKATGKTLLQYAQENLFSPLGITVEQDLELKSKEANEHFLKSKGISGWVRDPQGFSTAGWGLTLTTRDMAKFGQLYLNEGTWEGRTIVSRDWVQESTSQHSQSSTLRYGYLWWLIDEQEQSYAALGQFGNVIYVNPTRKLVIAISSLYATKETDRIKLIRDYMEPVFAG